MTVKFDQRYLAIVLHLAGDSTITRCFHSFGFGIDAKDETEDTFWVMIFLLIGFLIVGVFFLTVERVLVGMISAELNNKMGIFKYFIIDYYDDIARVYFLYNKKYRPEKRTVFIIVIIQQFLL